MPGSGKTTVLAKLAHGLKGASGFYTKEIRMRGERLGFKLIGLDGAAVVIAHVKLPKAQRVGKYGVDIAAIDRAVEAALGRRRRPELYLVDEIGKMECLSQRFIARLQAILDGNIPLVATVAKRGGGFIAEVKRRPDCELWTLDRANRDAMPERISAWLLA